MLLRLHPEALGRALLCREETEGAAIPRIGEAGEGVSPAVSGLCERKTHRVSRGSVSAGSCGWSLHTFLERVVSPLKQPGHRPGLTVQEGPDQGAHQG